MSVPKHLHFSQNNEKLLLSCVQVTWWYGGWTNSFEFKVWSENCSKATNTLNGRTHHVITNGNVGVVTTVQSNSHVVDLYPSHWCAALWYITWGQEEKIKLLLPAIHDRNTGPVCSEEGQRVPLRSHKMWRTHLRMWKINDWTEVNCSLQMTDCNTCGNVQWFNIGFQSNTFVDANLERGIYLFISSYINQEVSII